jgi:hypothetical protein
MRTTVTLDDDIAEELSERARRQRVPFKQVLNETLRQGLGGLRAQQPFELEPHAGHLKPGIDDRRLNELAWET